MRINILIIALLIFSQSSFSQNLSLKIKNDLIEVFLEEEGLFNEVSKEDLLTQFNDGGGIKVSKICEGDYKTGIYEILFPVFPSAPIVLLCHANSYDILTFKNDYKSNINLKKVIDFMKENDKIINNKDALNCIEKIIELRIIVFNQIHPDYEITK